MSKENVSVLVANDNIPDIDVIKSALYDHKDITYSIDIAGSDLITLEKASESKFDVVLMNRNLPGTDGIAMLKKITEKKLGMPVIMIVAEGDEKFGVKAMDKGAYDYLTREEIKTESLSRAIRRAIQRKKLENDIKKSLEKMQKLAIKDGLTGLFNHNHFREELRKEYKKAKRHLQPLTCIMLDLDHFKSVNDNCGHQFGDYVLSRSADILRRLVRDTDFIARYGGEEFFVILPNTELKGAYTLADRIRVAFANNVFKSGATSMSVTVSVGISSTSDRNVINDDGLIMNADKALYRAKWRGRNNVCMYEDTEIHEKEENIKEETEKVEEFLSRLDNISEKIKLNCIESAHELLLEMNGGSDYISKHSVRVSGYVEKLTKGLLMSDEETNVVKCAALLHDIGMVGISPDILRKKGKLTSDEYNAIKRHSNIGVKIIEKTKLFDKELPIILYHHERYDGTGYPHKLKGDSIPYGARILAITESYDAMVSCTEYKKAGSHVDALAELKACSGTQFDPHIVNVFIAIISQPEKV